MLRTVVGAPTGWKATIHGGGFEGGSLYTHRKLYGHLAKRAGVRVLLTSYRHTPEHRYPAQIDDSVAAFRWVQDQGLRTALIGDSSGGGLAVHTALRSPGAEALMLISPWFDMDKELSASSYDTNAGTDLLFTRPLVLRICKYGLDVIIVGMVAKPSAVIQEMKDCDRFCIVTSSGQ